MSEQERIDYHDTTTNKTHVSAYANRLLAAEALVLVYPVWNEGFPAILKGFFDRVFIPGVSFKIGPDGAAAPSLQNLKKIAAVCTYGADRLSTVLLGDPPRRVVKRLLRAMPGHSVRCDYLGLYDMNHATPRATSGFPEEGKAGLRVVVSASQRVGPRRLRRDELSAPKELRRRVAAMRRSSMLAQPADHAGP